jgi:hypothetical protein
VNVSGCGAGDVLLLTERLVYSGVVVTVSGGSFDPDLVFAFVGAF